MSHNMMYVTHKIPDDSSDSGSRPESDCEEDEKASVRDQKAILAFIILTLLNVFVSDLGRVED
eukprot:scaffold192235_cov43-Cyclotella_meneghiniana.AAC.3